MQVIITAVGPDHRGLADPIIHHVTGVGGNIAEIQMFDHDEQSVFSMLLRIEVAAEKFEPLQTALKNIGEKTGLSVRVWSPELREKRPRIAICTTYRPETPLALLKGVQDGTLNADVALMIGNRPNCKKIADEFGVDWHNIGNERGEADNKQFVRLCDEYEVDYIILARYMRVLPPEICWEFAGGRIINLHHGLLPSFPGLRPYHDAYASRMLTFGATCHFIVPELDAGNQIINQATFTAAPGEPLDEIIKRGQAENEPKCLLEGVRRVVSREVQLHFHRIVAR